MMLPLSVLASNTYFTTLNKTCSVHDESHMLPFQVHPVHLLQRSAGALNNLLHHCPYWHLVVHHLLVPEIPLGHLLEVVVLVQYLGVKFLLLQVIFQVKNLKECPQFLLNLFNSILIFTHIKFHPTQT